MSYDVSPLYRSTDEIKINNHMTLTTLRQLKDEQKFKINPRGPWYEINTVQGKYAYCTSDASGRTYSFKLSKKVLI